MDAVLRCPYCGTVQTHHESVGPKEPQPGDAGICWDCGRPSILTALGFLRRTTEQERATIEAQHEYRRFRQLRREVPDSYRGVDAVLRALRRAEDN